MSQRTSLFATAVASVIGVVGFILTASILALAFDSVKMMTSSTMRVYSTRVYITAGIVQVLLACMASVFVYFFFKEDDNPYPAAMIILRSVVGFLIGSSLAWLLFIFFTSTC